MDKKAFGQNLKLARKNCGITSDKLAELCDVNPVYIRQLESGTKTPSLPMLIKLCNSLSISSDALLKNELSVNEITYLTNISNKMKSLTTKQLEQLDIITNTFFTELKE